MEINRDIKFGRLLAIANILSERVIEKNKRSKVIEYWDRYQKRPMEVFSKIHADIMEYTHKFGETEMYLFDLFVEILADMTEEEFTNEPLNPVYTHEFSRHQHNLENVMGVEKASKIWGLSSGYIKNLCSEGKIKAKKIGNTWVIDKRQDNPSHLKNNLHERNI